MHLKVKGIRKFMRGQVVLLDHLDFSLISVRILEIVQIYQFLKRYSNMFS